ncbi:nitrogen fixation protein NifH [Dehalococcoides mccartyi]|nr:prenyltransferase-like domain-containing protein [Dehalococcoides mccartyi DCMB5]AQX73974.1 nitrogen fixation protein NifH [Dehalococcoides mccartyi]
MMSEKVTWKDKLRADPVPWLLEPDQAQPAVRYFTLKDIIGCGEHDAELKEAKAAIMLSGPVPSILAAQSPEGYWLHSGAGYSPKYQSTVWQIIFLAQLGADKSDAGVRKGCNYLFEYNLSKGGWFSYNGTPSGFLHCLAGNLESALIDLGWLEDERLQIAVEKHARFITGEGMADSKTMGVTDRYYMYTPGPMFSCSPNSGLPCGWGAVKSLNALSKIPPSKRSPAVIHALDRGLSFLLKYNPAAADYPFGTGDKPSSSWFKFGYPMGYAADILQTLDVLSASGYARDPRLAEALDLVLARQNPQGRWPMECRFTGKTWMGMGKNRQPSKWITLRALRVLKAAFPE